MKAKLYLHSNDDDMYYKGGELDLSEKARYNFASALYEVEFEVDIDETTGEYIIEKVIEGKQTLVPENTEKEQELMECLRAAFLYWEAPYHKDAMDWMELHKRVPELMQKYDPDFYKEIVDGRSS